MTKRTQISFQPNGDIWPLVDGWASVNGYNRRAPSGSERLYQKGTGMLVAPMMLSIRQEGAVITLEAWVRSNLFIRMMSFFILPAEIGIESGGFKAVLPRKIARDAVNGLLHQLGVPLIP
jgi:hypothetical protein